ncbi:hypothetical protein HMPREF1981_01373 [Bacteroides pyogenes F0041]|uniref:Uncharacterized protein n=1 Tax=Bacteroides pyogenes F0041 TaxID=1321819 RepID=U2E0N1_9BACE|nr:hypothetical protein HMPREF1981_01373 [Bacteroides pyogenes F0041]
MAQMCICRISLLEVRDCYEEEQIIDNSCWQYNGIYLPLPF